MPTQNRYQTASSGVGTNTRKRAKNGEIRRPDDKSPVITPTGTTGFIPIAFKTKQFHELQYPDAYNPYLKMWEDLKPAYLNYCTLCGVKPRALSETNRLENISIAFNHLKLIIHKEQKEATLNIDNDLESGTYHFIVHREFDMHHDLFAYPLLYLQYMKDDRNPLFPYIIRFSKLFLTRLGFDDWGSGHRLTFSVEWLFDWAAETAEEDNDAAGEMLKLHSIYTNGNALKMLKTIDKAGPFTIRHVRELKRKKYKCRFTEYLRKWMITGFDLLNNPAAQPIPNMEYRADPNMTSAEYEEQYNYGDPLGLQELFIVVWDDDDSVTEGYTEELNQMGNEYGVNMPNEFEYITSSTTTVFKSSNWFYEIKSWMAQGFRTITDYKDNIKKLNYNNEQHDRAANLELQA